VRNATGEKGSDTMTFLSERRSAELRVYMDKSQNTEKHTDSLVRVYDAKTLKLKAIVNSEGEKIIQLPPRRSNQDEERSSQEDG